MVIETFMNLSMTELVFLEKTCSAPKIGGNGPKVDHEVDQKILCWAWSKTGGANLVSGI